MSIVITSDIQAEFNTLDLCQQAWDEVLGLCKKYDAKTIAYLGDGKQAYDPVSIRVIRWWQDAIRQAKKKGIGTLFLLGNHDRVGRYTDADNWLPIIRRAGAEVFDTPSIVKVDKCRLFMLPFSSNETARLNMQELLKSHPDKTKDILLFHHDLSGAKYNQQGSVSDASLSTSDLHTNSFRYCMGGHVHAPQTIEGNTYYVGSPFCHDFGEVNQQKRYLVVGNNGITSKLSSIPRWYDPSINGFEGAKPKSWKGSRIRLSVSCDASTDYGRKLEKARIKAERKYKGADIFVVPKFLESASTDGEAIKAEDSDERKLKQYIGQTRTGQSKIHRRLVLEYMLEKLSHFSGGLRTGSKVKFLYAKGKNFLPFEKVKTDFTHKGITVIQGINKDRTDKSNGSGKTSLVQILPVSMFGRTFKEQKADRWANRWGDGESYAEVCFRDCKSRKIVVRRGRRPVLLSMSIDGKDVSSGMKSNDKDGTQAQIEQVTGFTWQTLANAIYIDRAISDSFLSGTKKQRTEILNRFQNLERFQKAFECIKKDERKNREALLQAGETLSYIRGTMQECNDALQNLIALSKFQINSVYKEYEKRKHAVIKWDKGYAKPYQALEKQEKEIRHKYSKVNMLLKDAETSQRVIEADEHRLGTQLNKWIELSKKDKCPTCLQKVSRAWLKAEIKELKRTHNKCIKAIVTKREEVTKLKLKAQLLEGENAKIQSKLGKWDSERLDLIGAKKTAKRQWMELASEHHGSHSIINKTKSKVKELLKEKAKLKAKIAKYRKLNTMYEFAMEAFSRDGIPAFLNRQLCPILNKAADYYAELFSDREIQVKFDVQEGELVPNIINVKGGETIEDQSTGERALAGLIASFALREVAPKCNLLILDEPCEGLDQQTTKQFAKALQKLKHRFGSIWLITHNVNLLSELSGERVVTVVKHNKISTLQKEN